jgi:hypothetical protein
VKITECVSDKILAWAKRNLKNKFAGRLCRLVAAVVLTHTSLQAQTTNQQVWFEYMLNYPFANSYNFESIFQYKTLLDSPRWRSMVYNPRLEYSFGPHIDLVPAFVIAYTNQVSGVNTFEVRPSVGVKIHLTPNHRILTRLFIRVEQRYIENLESKDWQSVTRPRLRAESIIPINRKSYREDRLWYGLLDAEWFFTVDDDVDERFANRFRLRAGLGYRLNYNSRFELIYMIQESKHAMEESFYTSDQIFRFRYKHYLRKHIPAKNAG